MQNLSSSELKEVEGVIDKSSVDEIEVLYLHSNDQTHLNKFDSLLSKLLPSVRKQVYLDSFTLDESVLKTVLYNSTMTKDLALINCKIGPLSDNFRLKPKDSFKLKTLDLFWTAIEKDSSYLDHKSLPILLRAINNSNTGKSLKYLHVSEDDYHKDSLSDMIKAESLGLKPKVDRDTPEPYY